MRRMMFANVWYKARNFTDLNNKIMNKEQKIDEAMNWWYDISDHQTTELIMKYKLRKPIKEQDIVKLFALYGVSKTK